MIESKENKYIYKNYTDRGDMCYLLDLCPIDNTRFTIYVNDTTFSLTFVNLFNALSILKEQGYDFCVHYFVPPTRISTALNYAKTVGIDDCCFYLPDFNMSKDIQNYSEKIYISDTVPSSLMFETSGILIQNTVRSICSAILENMEKYNK